MREFFQAGAAQVDITPPINLPMDGYLAREGNSLGIHDPLMAQVLVLNDGERRVALVTLDTMAVSADFTDPLRAAMAQKLNTVPAAIMICPSHTHCGPCGLQNWFPPGQKPALDAGLVSMVQARILDAAQSALEQMEPVRLAYAQAPIEGIGGDRNQRDAPVDSQVTVLCFERDDHTPLCIVFHYACHPTVLGADTHEYSADLIGAARERLCEQYPGAIPMFINGALGDVSPRYQRREQSFAEVSHMGNILANHVAEMMQNLQPENRIAVNWDALSLELPFRALSPESTVISASPGSGRFEETRAQGSIIQANLHHLIGGRLTQSVELSLLRIGSWTLVGVPGEPFNALAIAVRAAEPHALIVGMANDYVGYLPTQTAINLQSYEALSSPFDARALQHIEAAVIDQFAHFAHQ